jgi:hypothetical protein
MRKVRALAKRDFKNIDRSRVAGFQEAQRRTEIQRVRPKNEIVRALVQRIEP